MAALMGAAGVALAAGAAHLPDATRLAAASSMLLFHAAAVIGAVLLTAQRLARPGIGLIAAFGFIVGGALFAGDLTLRQAEGHGLFTMAAPTGGTLLILSWLALAIAIVWPRRT
ncbi:MAG: DUF423 domain-containing protein [Xanthobacteraceae bacterium]|nr:DUF423 domain-containing protein [Xanthobacteraceae bacterium]